MKIDYVLADYWRRGGWTTSDLDGHNPFNPPYGADHFDLWQQYMSSMDIQVYAGATVLWDRVVSEGLLLRHSRRVLSAYQGRGSTGRR